MIKNILWDFDGVILDSMPVREYGFRKIFESYDGKLVNKLIDYHTLNGGLSRYVKIRYFYEELLGKDITDDNLSILAENFSIIMKNELTDKKYLISTTVDFIKNYYMKYRFHIVSGSDHKELNFLSKELGLSEYFISIHGSPTPKNTLVEEVLMINDYKKEETILIGDSFNDYEAANVNKIGFYGFNNVKLQKIANVYLKDYRVLSHE